MAQGAIPIDKETANLRVHKRGSGMLSYKHQINLELPHHPLPSNLASPQKMEKGTEAPPILTGRGIFPMTEPQSIQLAILVTPEGNDDLEKDMCEMVELMKTFNINLMNSNHGAQGQGRGRGGEGYGRGGGRGFYGGRRPPPTCYSCGNLGYYSTECDQPPRAGGDMFPLPSSLPDMSRDYAKFMWLKLKMMKGLVDLLQRRRVRQRWSM